MTTSSSASSATPERPRRTPRESRHETSEIMMPHDANILGPVFGGAILAMMDKAAAVAAIRHARRSCVTVSIDRVDFKEPIHVGDLVVMKASVNYAGRTSVEVGVRVETEDMISGVRRHTNSAYLTFVAVDRNGRPVEVPELVPETAEDRRRLAAARERRRRRLEERTAEAEAVAADAAEADAAADAADAAVPTPTSPDMRTFLAPDGASWRVEIRVPGSSNVMVVFHHPDGRTSRRNRYAWYAWSGPEARDVTARLTPAQVLERLTDADLARLFRRSMPVQTSVPALVPASSGTGR